MIAIHPPAYFPGLRYMALLQQVDAFVLADTFPYTRRSMQRRSRLRNPQGWQWITVPLQARQQGRPLVEAAINDDDPWTGKHWRAFQYNYRSTPYFEYFEPELEPLFTRKWHTLGALTCAIVELMRDMMGIGTSLMRASALDGAPDTVAGILDRLDSTNRVVYDEKDESDATSAEHVLRFDAPTYRQNFPGFEAGMSAVDLLFNYGPEARSRLTEHARIEPLAAR
jgi:hypothetical protein